MSENTFHIHIHDQKKAKKTCVFKTWGFFQSATFLLLLKVFARRTVAEICRSVMFTLNKGDEGEPIISVVFW